LFVLFVFSECGQFLSVSGQFEDILTLFVDKIRIKKEHLTCR